MFLKGWNEALLEWEKLGREHAQSHRPSPEKGPNKAEPVSNGRWNSCVFHGNMLACWLALQDDVQYVKHDLSSTRVGTCTHVNAADEFQRFLQAYPWANEGVDAS